MPQRRPFRKAILWSLVWIWGIWTVAAWLMMVRFPYYRPLQPVPLQGRVFPYFAHGTTVYLTWTEHVFIVELSLGYVMIEAVLYNIAAHYEPWSSYFSN
jgi:hypothetical protein